MKTEQTQKADGGNTPGVGQTTTVAKIKSQFPELQTLSDDQIVNVMHSQYYPDRSRDEVAKALGVKSELPDPTPVDRAQPAPDLPTQAKTSPEIQAVATVPADPVGPATAPKHESSLDWGGVGGWILIVCVFVGIHVLLRAFADRSAREVRDLALAPVVRHPIATGLAATLLATCLALLYWVGKPWDKEQCIAEASNKPSDRGVRLAEQQCHAQFGK